MPHYYPEHTDESSLPQVGETVAAYSRSFVANPPIYSSGRETLRQKFDDHYQRWIAAPHLLMGVPRSHKWHTYKDYQAIIAMGKEAVPFIIDQLKEGNYYLMHLLPQLTGMDALTDTNGYDAATAQLWIQRYS